MRHSTIRRGFTLIEMLAVLAVLLVLGAVIIPSLSSLYGNSRQKAGADMVRARLADARALAMETGTVYRVAVSEDKLRVRVAPDGADFADAAVSTSPTVTDKAIETTFEKEVTAEVEVDPDDPPPVNTNGYYTVATFLPDGTCKEDKATVVVREGTFAPLKIEVRGVTGGSRTLPQVAGGAK